VSDGGHDVYRWGVTTLADLDSPRGADFGTPRRWAVFVLGLTSLIVGIALSIAAGLGVGSWQVLETGLVELTGASFGVVAFTESVVVVVLAWVWLRQRPWIATAVLAFGGVGIGLLLEVLATPATLPGQVGLLGVGIVLLAVGAAFYLASDFGASAQDALFVGLYHRYRLRPGRVRLVMDVSLVAVGAMMGGQVGVGTVLVTIGLPLGIEPALRLGHRLADTPLPVAMRP
jgi:uncharacterized protein